MRRMAGALMAAGLVITGLMTADTARAAQTATWGHYGGDAGGQRFSPATQITPANVDRLQEIWRVPVDDAGALGMAMKGASFENTPILADGRLYTCSPFNVVMALDPGTGRVLWRYDPHLDTTLIYPNEYVCRGVAFARVAGHGVCVARIYENTADRRLIALDAATGKPCAGFGKNGTVVIPPGLEKNGPHARIQTTSAPVVSHGVVVVGSSIGDNQRVKELRGTVYAFDAVTGAQRWSFDPLADQPASFQSGAANVWAPMSVDDARGLVFLPVSSASPDFWGGKRRGDGAYANSVVALSIETGKVVWSFQTTHHDVWDYDLASQPTLATVTYHGKTVPVVLQPTKQGLLFTLNRETGKPVIPVVERKVPQGGAPGEQLSPTQPFPIAPKPLAASHITPDMAYGLTFWDRGACRKAIADARHDGLFTPPSVQGTLIYPFTGGGDNWGGLAFDPRHDIVYVNTSNVLHKVTLIPRKDYAAVKKANPGVEISPNTGAPFGMERETVLSPLGMPCNPPPWGQLHAIDMHTGHELWAVPLGTTQDMMPFSQYLLGATGTPSLGGPVVTAGGLVFVGATMDNYLRAFDAKSGKEVWKARLPATATATPMTYLWKGRQIVVVGVGGDAMLGNRTGGDDMLIAFVLPDQG